MTERTRALSLSLSYTHGVGDLAEYFAALAEGRAVASRCARCGGTRVPPVMTCPDDGAPTEAVELAGSGRVAAATRTETALPLGDGRRAPFTFVLVAMDGADNLMFGRLREAGEIAVGIRVRLTGDDGRGGHPASAAVFEVLEVEAGA